MRDIATPFLLLLKFTIYIIVYHKINTVTNKNYKKKKKYSENLEKKKISNIFIKNINKFNKSFVYDFIITVLYIYIIYNNEK